MATNRADTLDPALLRPGRLDRKIEFPMPDRRQKRLVFQVRAKWVSVKVSTMVRCCGGGVERRTCTRQSSAAPLQAPKSGMHPWLWLKASTTASR